MILTDDNFATIVKAVELGRGLYDNLTKYIRFQMGVLVGFIVTFLGASIFNVVGGVPFLPLQTLWVNFTTQVFQSIALGYDKPSKGLMRRKPRNPEDPILTRALLLWLATMGAVMGLGTLGIIWWASDNRTDEIARTMGVTTFAIMNLLFSFCSRDEKRSVFDLEVLEDKKFLMFSGMSVAAIVLGTELNVFQRLINTVSLTVDQWLACIVVSLSVVAASEVRKIVLRHRSPDGGAGEDASTPAADAKPIAA
jgi:Ca2+-transporting ATPase